MNLNELSQKLEDHLTDQDIQEAQELLDNTYQEIVDMRGELVEAQAEIDALKAERDALLALLKQCRTWMADGENSDDSEFYPDYAEPAYIRVIQDVDAVIAKARGDQP